MKKWDDSFEPADVVVISRRPMMSSPFVRRASLIVDTPERVFFFIVQLSELTIVNVMYTEEI